MSLSGYLDRPGWQIDLRTFLSDGKAVPSPEVEALHDEWRGLLGEPFASMIQDPALPLELLEYMKPAGTAQEEMLHGALHYRIDMIPMNGGGLYQQITLWVDKSGKLARTRATSMHRRAELTTITDYTRFDGLDVPTHRQYEGHVQSRRRSRISTLFFTIEASYDAFHFTEGPSIGG